MSERHQESKPKSYNERRAEKTNAWIDLKRAEWIELVRSAGMDQQDAADLERIIGSIKPLTGAELDRGASPDSCMRSFRYSLSDDFFRADEKRREAEFAWKREKTLSIPAELTPEKRALMESLDLILEDSFKQP